MNFATITWLNPKESLDAQLSPLFVFFLQAYHKLEELQKLLPSQNVKYYISQASLEALQKELGIPMERARRRNSVKEEDEVEEDLNMSWRCHAVMFGFFTYSLLEALFSDHSQLCSWFWVKLQQSSCSK